MYILIKLWIMRHTQGQMRRLSIDSEGSRSVASKAFFFIDLLFWFCPPAKKLDFVYTMLTLCMCVFVYLVASQTLGLRAPMKSLSWSPPGVWGRWVSARYERSRKSTCRERAAWVERARGQSWNLSSNLKSNSSHYSNTWKQTDQKQMFFITFAIGPRGLNNYNARTVRCKTVLFVLLWVKCALQCWSVQLSSALFVKCTSDTGSALPWDALDESRNEKQVTRHWSLLQSLKVQKNIKIF